MHTSKLEILTGGSLLRGSLALSLVVPTGLTVNSRPALAMMAASEEEPPPVDAQASSDSNDTPATAEPLENTTASASSAESNAPTSATSPCLDGITWNGGATPPPSADQMAKNRHLAAENKKTDRMLIASYILLSIGGSLLLGSTGAIYGGSRVETDEDPELGSTARGVGYGTLAFSLASVATSVTLMAVGFSRRKKARNGTLASTPVVGPGFAGGSLRVRF